MLDGLAVVVCADWGARRSPASSFLRRLCDSESRPRASKSKKCGVGDRETWIWDPGHSGLSLFVCSDLWFILPAELEDSFQNGLRPIASLGHFFFHLKERIVNRK